MDNPLSGLTWLYPREGRSGSADDLLRRLAREKIELTHEAFNDLQPWRAASHLRDLLMACGVLPAIDKQVCAFERWLGIQLASVTDSERAQVLRRFTAWVVLPRLVPARIRSRSARVPEATPSVRSCVPPSSSSGSPNGNSPCPGAASQTSTPGTPQAARIRNAIRPFLQWCMANKLTGRFQLPQAVTGHSAPMPEPQRSKAARPRPDRQWPTPPDRVAAAIVLLYAQPVAASSASRSTT